jgi:hypothetical protein
MNKNPAAVKDVNFLALLRSGIFYLEPNPLKKGVNQISKATEFSRKKS